ncbi:uncharacterized protein LY89DRAFT_189530 [Mollisia scopiformis]|uniref:Uncharacterized protein n=1 Tax=Mollisia scopiformis TaxID=149040 RepID=A0A194XTV9_MOLSC|nr:uncharacterized protein LY89DRAFT_189530 [Mollisia scopiformis]KUJ23648.1 hypothetical protein LY89DRAFT_189530 [Mollisia scopiformis]
MAINSEYLLFLLWLQVSGAKYLILIRNSAFLIPIRMSTPSDEHWLNRGYNPFCCNTWKPTVFPSPTKMPTSFPPETVLPTTRPSWTDPSLTRVGAEYLRYAEANDHPRLDHLLACINEKKVVGPPAAPKDRDLVVVALDSAPWMVYLGYRDGHTLHTYLVPSNTRDGYLMEICRGNQLDGFKRAFPSYVDRFSERSKGTIRLKCEEHGNKSQCWFFERKELNSSA